MSLRVRCDGIGPLGRRTRTRAHLARCPPEAAIQEGQAVATCLTFGGNSIHLRGQGLGHCRNGPNILLRQNIYDRDVLVKLALDSLLQGDDKVDQLQGIKFPGLADDLAVWGRVQSPAAREHLV